MTAPVRLYTVEEFEQIEHLPENHDRLLELIHGRIIKKRANPGTWFRCG